MMLFWRVWYSGRVLRWVLLALPLLGLVAIGALLRGPVTTTESGSNSGTATTAPEPLIPEPEEDSDGFVYRFTFPDDLDQATLLVTGTATAESCLSPEMLSKLGASGPGLARNYYWNPASGITDAAAFERGDAVGWLEVDYPALRPSPGEGEPVLLRVGLATRKEDAEIPANYIGARAPSAGAGGVVGVAETELPVRLVAYARYVDAKTGTKPVVYRYPDGTWDEQLFNEVLRSFVACGVLRPAQ